MKEIVSLNITHFRFAIGGEHYYGTLNVRTKEEIEERDGKRVRVTRFGAERHPHDRTEVKRKVGAKEALYLNKKDNGGERDPFGVKAGDLVNRFNDRESLVETAKKTFAELFDDTDVLVVEGDQHGLYRALMGPEDVVEFLNQHQGLTHHREQSEFLDARGYLVRESVANRSVDC